MRWSKLRQVLVLVVLGLVLVLGLERVQVWAQGILHMERLFDMEEHRRKFP